ncbi:MAG: LytR/AlgR family response regulator transcription factor [Betaproteobacteria bacterium]
MPTAVIADDEPHLAQYLRARLAALWPELAIVATAASGTEAAAAIARHAPDVAFVDIRMPGATGLEVARELSGAARRPHLVFVTAYEQYAVEAFDANAADYLLKPVTEERLARTVAKLKDALGARQPAPDLERLLRRLAQQEPARNPLRWIRASKKSGEGEITEQIAVADVVYLQADDKYTCVYARQGSELREWLLRVSLSELARDLDPADFAQIHRSVIVNLHAVAGTRRDIAGKLFVRLREHARELPVARQYVHLFRQM